ncbi:hypothetical protein HPP92_004695 [Vanilla planifolia]|uniref:Uncharacterized protein n=1 Tax=Vanilla planifolia TaxID=51239 RepID=A0A835RTM0_VANPL|nr:hypothetical protein HPP92_005040 [Vanilla planifolia]KAG0493701.1 hypothetical protein HPP92_004695 [Vanilla planifolia]
MQLNQSVLVHSSQYRIMRVDVVHIGQLRQLFTNALGYDSCVRFVDQKNKLDQDGEDATLDNN